jgi:hypothetical protein
MMGFIELIQSNSSVQVIYNAIADVSTLKFIVTLSSVLSLLQSTLTVSWKRILTQEHSHWITHSKYHTQSILFTAGLWTLNRTALNEYDASVPRLPSSYPCTLVSRNSADFNDILCPLYNPSARTAEESQLFYYCMNSSPRKRAYAFAP